TERFWRRAASPAGGGSGLGLSIVAAAVATGAGAFRLSPRPGGGGRAEVTLPADPPPAGRYPPGGQGRRRGRRPNAPPAGAPRPSFLMTLSRPSLSIWAERTSETCAMP